MTIGSIFAASRRAPAHVGKIGVSVLLAGWLGYPGGALAVPYAQQETFESASLAPKSWRILSGSSAGVTVQEKTLRLAAISSGPTILAYRFYPLRSGKRPAFGDFTAEAYLQNDAIATPMAFGLLDNAGGKHWQVWLQYRSAERKARLVRVFDGKTEFAPWKDLALTAAPDTLRLVRRGDGIEAEIAAGAEKAAVGRWRGTAPQIMDFALEALPGDSPSAAAPAVFSGLNITPLAPASAVSQALPRQGRPLPGIQLAGGPPGREALYGYLWTPREKPVIDVRISNLKSETNRVVLKTWVTDWQDRRVAARDYPLRLTPTGAQTIGVVLPRGVAGTFHLWRLLTDAQGSPLEAERVTDWAVTRAPAPSELPDSSPFGIHGEPFARVGAKWHRAWDYADFFWRDTEPQPSVWNWGPMDEFVRNDQSAGLKSLIVLAGAPAWASEDPGGDLLRTPPKDMNAWANYCRQIARRYRGKVKYYEVWNEPNNNGIAPKGFFFLGPPERYFDLLKAAYTAVKAEDPQAQILAPSGTGQFLPFLQRIVDLGGLQYFDILSFHPYTIPMSSEVGYGFNDQKNYAYRVQAAREVMRKGGAIKPIWVSEIGFDLGEEPKQAGLPLTQDQIAAEAMPGQWPNWSPGWSYRPADERRKADFVPRAMMLTMALGVQKMFLHHRLLTAGEPFLAAPSFGWTSRLLSSARYDRAYAWPGAKRYSWGSDVEAHGFTLRDGRYALAFWRVEDETLTMNAANEKAVQGVQSAPLAGADQRGIDVTYDKPSRVRYFDPARVVPVTVALKLPAGTQFFDLFGNAISPPASGRLPIDEAPRYLIFPHRPAILPGRVTRGTPIDAPTPADAPAPTAGALTPSGASGAARADSLIITVDKGGRQTFAGTGATMNGWTPAALYNTQVTRAQNRDMARMLWGDAKMRSIRLWIHPGDVAAGKIDSYVDGYVGSHKLPDALAAGAKDLILAPNEIPEALGDGHGRIRDDAIPQYAALLADFIRQFKDKTGILINHCGVLNEPNDRPVKPSNAQWPVLIKALRQALDARGLPAVGIVAPESANCGADAYAVVDAIQSDTQAWASLQGVATHSYNNAATEEMAKRAAGKSYWVTEAGGMTDTEEQAGDALQAASIASRFLNDVNHGVTHWQFFIGFEQSDPNGDSGRILKYDVAPFHMTVLQKYYSLKQLAETFDVGAVFRHSASSLDGEMDYSYVNPPQQKPHVNAAVARNPDGTWGVGLSNFTSDDFQRPSTPDWYRRQGGYPARTFDVTVRIPELAKARAVRFTVRRSNRGVNDAPRGEVVMHYGEAIVPNVGPFDLITLRSQR
ncbi:hypothetical protein CCAX7_45460 [Capsulimonas corticalis]|uniref:Glycosyl hydrolase family 59 catalytic domain-containing protein n=1 Tax=Capsulimonas corticalis TaxID=2219043 RepID=A0A402D614_9BACT|nr:hypothetical protein [Capsulimonas corticalis]BDI32495.1 hypothetical protein CCAX7_45460 [Capsulimonas corticalis]